MRDITSTMADLFPLDADGQAAAFWAEMNERACESINVTFSRLTKFIDDEAAKAAWQGAAPQSTGVAP